LGSPDRDGSHHQAIRLLWNSSRPHRDLTSPLCDYFDQPCLVGAHDASGLAWAASLCGRRFRRQASTGFRDIRDVQNWKGDAINSDLFEQAARWLDDVDGSPPRPGGVRCPTRQHARTRPEISRQPRPTASARPVPSQCVRLPPHQRCRYRYSQRDGLPQRLPPMMTWLTMSCLCGPVWTPLSSPSECATHPQRTPA
jgi:hypothetical protein